MYFDFNYNIKNNATTTISTITTNDSVIIIMTMMIIIENNNNKETKYKSIMMKTTVTTRTIIMITMMTTLSCTENGKNYCKYRLSQLTLLPIAAELHFWNTNHNPQSLVSRLYERVQRDNTWILFYILIAITHAKLQCMANLMRNKDNRYNLIVTRQKKGNVCKNCSSYSIITTAWLICHVIY